VADSCVALAIILTLGVLVEWRRRRRRAWQYSLADVLGVMLTTCVGLSWWMWHERQHEAEQAFVRSQGLELQWFNNSGVEYRGPAWLRRAVGQDNLPQFNRIIAAELREDQLELLRQFGEQLPVLEILHVRFTPEEDELAQVARLRRLKDLDVGGNVTDEGLRHIGRMTNLRLLSFNASLVTDSGLEQLKPLRKLEYLYPSNGSTISADGLRHLASLPRLKFISLWAYEIDDRDLEAIAGMSNLTGIDMLYGSINCKNLEPLTRLANLDHIRLVGVDLATRDLSALLRCKAPESVEWDGTIYFGRNEIIEFVLGN